MAAIGKNPGHSPTLSGGTPVTDLKLEHGGSHASFVDERNRKRSRRLGLQSTMALRLLKSLVNEAPQLHIRDRHRGNYLGGSRRSVHDGRSKAAEASF